MESGGNNLELVAKRVDESHTAKSFGSYLSERKITPFAVNIKNLPSKIAFGKR